MTKTSAAAVARPHGTWADARLVRACLDGNEEAWNAIVDKYRRLIYSIPVKQGLSPDDCADIFQSVCVELLKELPKLREPQALAGWLIKVTTHKCFHLHRMKSRYVESGAESFVNETASDALTLDEVFEAAEREQALRDAVDALSSRCTKLVKMLFFSLPPVPYEAVARQLGLARGSIGFIRRRCLDRLRRSLEGKGFTAFE